jgi:hypothetical protein
MKTVFIVMEDSFSPSEGGYVTYSSPFKVFFDKTKAEKIVEEMNQQRSSPWSSEFSVEEVEVG